MSFRLAVLIVLSIIFTACTDRNQSRIESACVRAGASIFSEAKVVSQRCECVARIAKKDLDPKDFALLASVSTIYMSSDDDETKLHEIVVSLLNSGITEGRAIALSADFIFLAHRIDRVCRS